MESLITSAWVPTASGLRPPSEVLLREPTATEQQNSSHLLKATLPSDVCTALSKAPLGPLLKWGTAPPPSPMSRFRALVDQAKAAEQARAAATAAPATDGAAAAPRIAAPGLSQVLAVWRALALAYDAGDKEVDPGFVRSSVSGLALLPLGRMLVRSPRAIARSASNKPQDNGNVSSAKATADDALVSGLVGCGWLLDVSTDAALREVARPLSSLLDLPRSPPVSTVQRWLQQLWRQPPPPTNSPTPDLLRLRSNFSLAVRYCIATVCGKRLDVAEVQLSEREAAQNHAAALSALPGLCLLLSHKPYRTTHGASWVRFPPTSSADPHPLLPDCEGAIYGVTIWLLQVLRTVVDGGSSSEQNSSSRYRYPYFRV